MQTTTNLNATVERLRATQREHEETSYETGREQGYAWARDLADHPGIARVINEAPDWARATVTYWENFPLPDDEAMAFEELNSDYERPDLDKRQYVAGWVQGVKDLWDEVAEYLD